ncbi:hypothetical protein COOONC_26541 [Cooperia oncophora]
MNGIRVQFTQELTSSSTGLQPFRQLDYRLPKPSPDAKHFLCSFINGTRVQFTQELSSSSIGLQPSKAFSDGQELTSPSTGS